MTLTRYKRLIYKIQGNFLSIFLCIGRYPASRGFAWLLAFIIPSQWRSRFVYALKTFAASRLLFALCMCYESATRGIFSSLTKRKERSRVFGTVTGWVIVIPKMNVASQRHLYDITHNSGLVNNEHGLRQKLNPRTWSKRVFLFICEVEF